MAGNSKNALGPYHLMNAVSMGASATSSAVGIQYLDNVAIQLNFTGTPTGTFAVQGSLDYSQTSTGTVINAGNWIPLTLASSPVASGAAGTILLDLNQLSFPWVRVVYTRSSGTGTLDSYISAKAV